MKISKKRLFEETASADVDLTIDDVNAASVDEIADVVQTSAEVATDGKETYSDEKAVAVAKELKTFAKGINAAAWAPLDVRNEVTDLLDSCLASAFKSQKSGLRTTANVLISGLPGSGKTGIVEQWANDRGVNLLQLSANDREIDATLNGFPVPIDVELDDGTQGKKAVRAISQALEPLEREKSVLFLDEFNRAPQSLRASLLKLINEHKAAGVGKDGMHRFDNLLFTIACINPSIPTDPGAIPLNDAERSRFLYQPAAWDSNKKEARNYLSFFIKRVIADLDRNDPDYVELYKAYMNAYNMAMYMLKHRDFTFDTENDLQSLYDNNCKMFNQRDLTNALLSDEGSSKERFLRWVDKHSNYLPERKQMLHSILDTWVPPVVADPADAGATPSSNNSTNDSDTDTVEKDTKKASNSFDDIFGSQGTESDGLFRNGSNGVTVVTAQEARQRLSSYDFTL